MQTKQSLTFANLIPDIVKKYSSNNALGFVDDAPITYSQMGRKINATISFFENCNIKPGDKVIILSENMPNWGIVYFALQCMGVIAVPLLPELNTNELNNVIQHSEAKTIFVSQSLKYKLSETDNKHTDLIIQINDYKTIKGNKVETIYREGSIPTRKYQPNENDLSVLLYTSGTTGNSKSVMLSQKNILSNVSQSNAVQNILETDKFLSVLPLAHTYENTIGFVLPMMKGAFVSYLKKPPTASVLIPAMQKIKPNIMLTVPLIIEKVFKSKVFPEIQKKAITRTLYKFRLTQKLLHRIAGKKLYKTFGGNLKFFGIGGAKLDATVERFLRDAKFPYAIGYGLTETSPLIAGSNASETRYQAIGSKVENCEMKINNPNKETGEGEIWVKGPNIMLGYYKNEKETKELLTDNGWFKTGDLGVFDKDGWLSHKGRLKNMIVGSNGENIYPEEIETVINSYNHVVESLVVEKKGKLVAMVHFNREELEQKVKDIKKDISIKVEHKIEELTKKVDEFIDELTVELQYYVNSKVNKFSRVQVMVIQHDPFQKTATKKIKRYLYV